MFGKNPDEWCEELSLIATRVNADATKTTNDSGPARRSNVGI